MSLEANTVDENFKGFQVEDYNMSLADKRNFQNAFCEVYSEFKFNSSDTDSLSEISMPSSVGTKTSAEMHARVYENKLTNPLLKIPMTEYGWKREIVCRTSNYSSDTSSKRVYDVYYYTPHGKKLRSSMQISNYLSTIATNLTVANFSFSKQAIGLSSDVEWVRDAKSKLENSMSFSSGKDKLFKTVQSSKPGKQIKKIKKRRLSKMSFYEDKFERKKKVQRTSLDEDITKARQPSMSEDDGDWLLPAMPGTNQETSGNTLTCSILCPKAMGCIPTLQCTSCLCLYHPQCLNLDPDVTYPKYVCINCKKKIQEEEKELSSKKTSPKLISGKPSLDQKVPVTSSLVKVPPFRPIIRCTSRITPRTPAHKNIRIRSSLNFSTIRPLKPILPYGKKPMRPLRPLAPVPSHNNANNVPSQHFPKINVPMQSIIQFGDKKFIAVPKKPVNAVFPTVTNLNLPSPADGKKSSENQLPSSKKSNNAVCIVKPKQPQVYVLKNGQLTPISSVKTSTDHQADTHFSPPKSEKSSVAPNESFLSLGSSGFKILVNIFQHLPLCDLLQAAQVNQFFHAASRHYTLWKSIHLKGVYVQDWDKFARHLNKNDTEVINFSDMITKTEPEDVKAMWRSVSVAIGKISTLCQIDLGKCAGPEIAIIKQCLGLTSFSCTFTKKSQLEFYGFSSLQNLSHLYIRGQQLSKAIGLKVLNIHNLSKLEHLTHLALTSVKQSSQDTNWAMFLADMPQLKWLELGECTNFTAEFVNHALAKLVNLKHLRLEMVTELIANDIVNTISTFVHLDTLELINFDVKSGFEEALCKCVNLQHILIIPTYTKQSAVTVRRMVMAFSGMSNTLKTIVWGLTVELLQVTEMLVTQHQFPLEPGVNTKNCVPIMPKVRLEVENSPSPDTKKSVQVGVITVDQLEAKLAKEIPSVAVKLIKVPYVNTLSTFLPVK